MFSHGKLGVSLVVSSLVSSTGSSTGVCEREVPHQEGEPGKIGKVGGQERRPHRSLQMIWGPALPWAPGKAGTIVLQPRLGEHLLT